jgi:hypothetical protein
LKARQPKKKESIAGRLAELLLAATKASSAVSICGHALTLNSISI